MIKYYQLLHVNHQSSAICQISIRVFSCSKCPKAQVQIHAWSKISLRPSVDHDGCQASEVCRQGAKKRFPRSPLLNWLGWKDANNSLVALYIVIRSPQKIQLHMKSSQSLQGLSWPCRWAFFGEKFPGIFGFHSCGRDGRSYSPSTETSLWWSLRPSSGRVRRQHPRDESWL